MFSKSKASLPEAAPAPIAQPAPAKQMRDRANMRSQVPSIISSDLTVRGTILSTGDVQIDGRIEGDVRVSSLVIGEKALIEGDVYADDAIIRGSVHGQIRARKVQLCSTCKVQGNILHEALAMEAGAFFEGNCRHSDNPLNDKMDPPASAATTKPAVTAPATPVAATKPAAQPNAPIRANGTDTAVAPVRAATPAAAYTPAKV